jgi:hypothetical protein
MRTRAVDHIDIAPVPLCLSRRERHNLHALRADYQVGRDFLGARDFRHLRFVRW